MDFVGHYAANGKPLSHYLDKIEEWEQTLGWRFSRHVLPHDGRAKTLQTGVSTVELCMQRFPGKFQIGPGLSLADGLQAGRWLLQQNVRFHSRCGEGIEALRQYHYAYDEDRKTYSSSPEHDWSSHDADSFRGAALVVKYTELATRKEPVPVRSPVLPEPMTLDRLFEDRERRASWRRRI